MTAARLEFRRSPWKHLGLLLMSAAFVAGGWWMATSADDADDRMIGWLCAGFFALCFAGIAVQMTRGGVAFAFDRAGITTDNFDGIIPWDEIESCGALTIKGNRFLSITFRDPERFLARVSAASRTMAEMNARMGWGHWAFSFAGVNPGIEQAIAYIRENAPRVAGPEWKS